MFSLDRSAQALVVASNRVQMLLVGPDKVPYFRCNDAARALGYVKCAQAVTKHVRPRQMKTLDELKKEGLLILGGPASLDQNELATRYMRESGLYRLANHSKLPMAEDFQDWVEEEVLPSIRKTGSYTVPSATIQPSATDGWAKERVKGVELMRLKNACLKDLIAGGFGQTGTDLYAIVANDINQAVLGYTESTTAYKQKHGLKNLSIPDILNLQGQVARGYAESCYQQIISKDLERLQGLQDWELKKEFRDMKKNLRAALELTGMGRLQDQVLTVEEAKARKRAKEEAKAETKQLQPPKRQKILMPAMKQQRLIMSH